MGSRDPVASCNETLPRRAADAIESAAGVLSEALARLARHAGVSEPQFRVLRILREAGEGLSCTQIAERMATRDPDITRLVDKLEKAGLVSRRRSDRDRRVVRSSITAQGLQRLLPVDEQIQRLYHNLFSGLDESALAAIVDQLGRLKPVD